MHCPHFIPSTGWMAAVAEMRKYRTFNLSNRKPAGNFLFH